MTAVWPGMIVEDSNLPTQISALRRVLDHERSQGSCIQTVSGRGYRFVPAVAQPAAEVQPAPSPSDGAPLIGVPRPVQREDRGEPANGSRSPETRPRKPVVHAAL